MTALMYHDVVDPGGADASGFPGHSAALYKISAERFEAHLSAFDGIAGEPPALTFDDGGASALRAADALERHGRRGWFFITVNYISTPGFLDEHGIRELLRRGHVVGSHSCSHPLRMALCDAAQLQDEWTRSRQVLADILGQPPHAASVPGGQFAARVAAAVRDAGFTTLFTSEPTRRTMVADGLSVFGRYTIQRWTDARTAAALAAGRPLACAAQSVVWNTKKLTKRVAGDQYLWLRRLIFGHADDVHWGDARAKG